MSVCVCWTNFYRMLNVYNSDFDLQAVYNKFLNIQNNEYKKLIFVEKFKFAFQMNKSRKNRQGAKYSRIQLNTIHLYLPLLCTKEVQYTKNTVVQVISDFNGH